MIVDDSSTVRNVIEKVIQITKIPVKKIIKCSNGKDALNVLNSEWVDLVITDIYMPVMDGYSFIREVKSLTAFKSLPILVISTEGSEKRKEELKAMGVTDILRKPFSPEYLRDALIKSLGGKEIIC
jgi:two-component system chemotaxis response regulator CheY